MTQKIRVLQKAPINHLLLSGRAPGLISRISKVRLLLAKLFSSRILLSNILTKLTIHYNMYTTQKSYVFTAPMLLEKLSTAPKNPQTPKITKTGASSNIIEKSNSFVGHMKW